MSRPLAWSGNQITELPGARHRGEKMASLLGSKHYASFVAVSSPITFILCTCATLEFRIQQEFRVKFYQFGEEETMTKEPRKNEQ
jgi:hypothetical protein